MSDQIRINCPNEVIEDIKRISAILAGYKEQSQEEQKEVKKLDDAIVEAYQIVCNRKNRLSEQGLEDQCEESMRKIRECQKEYDEACKGIDHIVKGSTQLSDEGKMLSERLTRLLELIIAAK